LILDLKKPGRFFYLFTKPNFNSWLVLGGYVLMIFGVLLAVWLGLMLAEGILVPWLVWLTAMFAVASAGYSAFLFAQARGRDFWQNPLLFWHLVVQAFTAGSAFLILIRAIESLTPYQLVSPAMFAWLNQALMITLLAGLAMIFGELFMKHGAEDSTRAGNMLLIGPLKKPFWLLAIGLGNVVPIVLVLWPISSILPNILAAVLVLFGLWMYEHLWIKAGQAVPLS
jgi:formate-dependent nitrite reductase membrane component NrfD